MSKESTKEENINVFKRLKPYYRYLLDVKWHFIAGLLASFVYSLGSGLGIPLMAKTVFPIIFNEGGAENINQVSKWRENVPEWSQELLRPFFYMADRFLTHLESLSAPTLLTACILLIPTTMLIRSMGAFFSSYFMSYCGFKVSESIRIKVFSHIQTMPIAFFQKYKSGDLLARVMGDTEGIKKVVVNVSNELFRQPATLFFALLALLVLAIQDTSFAFALIGALLAPLLIFPIRIVGKRLSAKAKIVARKSGDLTAVVTESLQSPLEIRSYNLQEKQIVTLRSRIKEIVRHSMKQVRYSLVVTPLIEVAAAGSLAFALYAGVSKGMDLGSFLGLATALYMAYEPIKKLGNIHASLKTIEAPLDRIEALLDEEDTVPESLNPESFQEPFVPSISFENVSFRYGKDAAALQTIDIMINPGDVVALVGPSGAGKTTFMNMIPRFYDATFGAVKIHGVDVKNIEKHDLRNQIGLVPQMPGLFNATVKDNIRIGKLDATDEEIIEAAKLAFAHDFIMQMPNGYDTMLSERGSSVSGGQRQRIAIARAFLKNAPILLLDEATSALDNESEQQITIALEKLMTNKTVLMIAHRETSLKSATRRLVFNDGRIVTDSRNNS